MKKFIVGFVNKHKLGYEILKFLIVGTITTFIDFFVMSLVIFLFDAPLFDYNLIKVFISNHLATTVSVVVATGLGFVTSTLFNYWASSNVVFSKTNFSKSIKGFALFCSLAIAGLFIHTFGMWLGYDILHLNEWIVKVLLTGVVMVFNYLTRKFIVFKGVKYGK